MVSIDQLYQWNHIMNRSILFFIFVLFTSVACDKEKITPGDQPEVQQFIQDLRDGKYSEMTLPTFTPTQIPALMLYRDEEEMITAFPRNPISSFYQPEVRLGIVVLWTIESIRLSQVDGAQTVMGFPSQNPALAKRGATTLELADVASSHKSAAKAYYDWWKANRNKQFKEYCQTDPLTQTPYRWH